MLPCMLLKSQMTSLLTESIYALSMSFLVPQHPDFKVTFSFSISFVGFFIASLTLSFLSDVHNAC